MGKNRYHHEDLKKEMIRKGLQLLNKDGYENFSLRKLAALCNVSHAAPYKHFSSKDELIQAITQEISTQFKEVFIKVVTKDYADPSDKLIDLCVEYVRFMVENPDYFRYVFMTNHGAGITFAPGEVIDAGGGPFSIALECARSFFIDVKKSTDWVSDVLTVWSQIHGLTLLLANQTIAYEGDYLAFARGMVEKYIRGGG